MHRLRLNASKKYRFRTPTKSRMPNKYRNRSRELTVKENDLEFYAFVTRKLGNGRVEVQDYEGNTCQAVVRGALRNVRIDPHDILLVQRREFQPNQSDILLKYTPEEVRLLKKRKELPDINQEDMDDQLAIVFDEDENVDVDAI